MADTSEARRLILDRFGSAHPLGELALKEEDLLFWLDGEVRLPPGPRQLSLSLPAGRYRIEYWDGENGELRGVELGSAPPLVLSPPGLGPFAIRVAAIGKD